MRYNLFEGASVAQDSPEISASNIQAASFNATLTGQSTVSATVLVQGYKNEAWQTFRTLNLSGSQRVLAGGVSPDPSFSKYRAKLTAIVGVLHMTLTTLAASVAGTPIQLKRVRRSFGILGDSFVANCHSIAANAAYSTENYGFAGGLAYKLGLFSPYTENYGVVGDITSGFISRAPAAFAGPTDIVITPSMTNDRTDATLTVDDTKANVLRLLSMARQAGKYYCVGSGTPRFGSRVLTAAQAADALEIKRWVLEDLPKLGVVVCNEWDGFTEVMTVEGLHPNPLGQAFLRDRWAEVLTANFDIPKPPGLTFVGQLYNATKRPTGSLTANPLLQGSNALGTSAATAVGAEAGSVIADGMTTAGTNLTGVTTLWGLENAAVGKAQTIQLKGTLTTAGGYLTFLPITKPALNDFVAGDVIEAIANVSNSADAPCLLSWQLELIITKPIGGLSTNIYFRAMDKYQEPFAMEAKGQGFLETQRYTVDKTETSISWRLACYPSNGVPQSNSVVKCWQVGLIKV